MSRPVFLLRTRRRSGWTPARRQSPRRDPVLLLAVIDCPANDSPRTLFARRIGPRTQRMAADDLSAPLGQQPTKRRRAITSLGAASHRRRARRCSSACSCCGRSSATIRSAANRWLSCRSICTPWRPRRNPRRRRTPEAAPAPQPSGRMTVRPTAPAAPARTRPRPPQHQDGHHHRRQDRGAAGGCDPGCRQRRRARRKPPRSIRNSSR